jgi:hypothetical protein
MADTVESVSTSSSADKSAPGAKKRRSRWRWLFVFVCAIVVLLTIGRLMLPGIVRWYVNRTLDRSILYQGRIGDIDIHLWRGAYSIHDVRITKTTSNIPVPFFSAPLVEFRVEWPALWHRKIVGQVEMDQPELNFVDAPSATDSQTGDGGPWMEMIRDLFPFKINSARVRHGQIHFRTFEPGRPVDVYLSRLDASIDNLTNINNDVTALITTVAAHGTAMDQATFDFKMRLDPFSYRPTLHMATRLMGLDVTKINDLALQYGKFDFKQGTLNLVIEVDAKEGQLTGYVKPLFVNLHLFSLPKDLREDDPLRFFWQALAGGVAQLLKNQPRNQFGTLIPFTGNLTTTMATTPDILTTIGNVLRNAFIRAYLPRLENGAVEDQGLEFGPASPIDSITSGDQL